MILNLKIKIFIILKVLQMQDSHGFGLIWLKHTNAVSFHYMSRICHAHLTWWQARGGRLEKLIFEWSFERGGGESHGTEGAHLAKGAAGADRHMSSMLKACDKLSSDGQAGEGSKVMCKEGQGQVGPKEPCEYRQGSAFIWEGWGAIGGFDRV
jgi:hypothetical protein